MKLDDFRPQKKNANKHTEHGMKMLGESMDEVGFIGAMTSANDGEIFDGSARIEKSATIFGGVDPIIVETDGTRPVIVKRTDIASADDPRAIRAGILANRVFEVDLDWDADVLAELAEDDMLDDLFTDKELIDLGAMEQESRDAEPQIDRAEELREKWGVELGQMWQLGEHRIICGDCTDAAVVERVMGGEKAVLLHADPPYGMGKEKDGIANDNLYREELDAFQMAWWRACRSSLEDNASVYIWGNAPDLWRLWYSELRDSERLTVRNEIVWKKEGAQGVGSDRHRMYPTTSERCLFFVLGEQGFNNNADNYWDGWESIRFYLAGEAEKVGLDNKKLKKICGVGMYSHWFGKSQWELITENHYKELQNAFNEYDTFKKEYDKLKKEFYATRAYFDNTHENMTDVWQFGRVFGDDRYGHATPKPVEMIERVVKTSARVGDLVLVPFGGTSPELIAAENLGRRCRAVEISPAYVAVTLERMAEAFPTLLIQRVDDD